MDMSGEVFVPFAAEFILRSVESRDEGTRLESAVEPRPFGRAPEVSSGKGKSIGSSDPWALPSLLSGGPAWDLYPTPARSRSMSKNRPAKRYLRSDKIRVPR